MISQLIMKLIGTIKKCYRHCVWLPYIKAKINHVGDNVYFPNDFSVSNPEKMFIGNDIYFGEGMLVLNGLAEVEIRDHVMFGPRVTIVTGNHRVDVVGKYMTMVGNEDKFSESNSVGKSRFDEPVVLEGDNWVGANATILKGVTIEKGAVIAAGAVVTKRVPAYEIWAGVPARCIKKRFTEEKIAEHERLLKH